MRDNAPTEITTLAADESLAYVREVEHLDRRIEALYDADGDDPGVRRSRAKAHHRLGIALKLAGVHAHLAAAEQLAGLRADLAQAAPDLRRRVEFSKGGVMDVAEAVGVVAPLVGGVVRPFIPGNVHHCSDSCPEDCPNAPCPVHGDL